MQQCVVQAGEEGAGQLASSSRGSGKRFEIKKWNAVAMWSWAICTDTCAICRNNLYEASIEYQANPNGALADQPGAGTCVCSSSSSRGKRRIEKSCRVDPLRFPLILESSKATRTLCVELGDMH